MSKGVFLAFYGTKIDNGSGTERVNIDDAREFCLLCI
jgi:hypothetical protein